MPETKNPSLKYRQLSEKAFPRARPRQTAKRGKPRFGILFAGVGCILASLLFLTLYYHL